MGKVWIRTVAKFRGWLLAVSLFSVFITVGPETLLGQTNSSGSGNEVENRQWAADYNGFALICRSLGMNFEIDEFAWLEQPADDRILVVIGECNLQRSRQIERFLKRGGAVLLASDEVISRVRNARTSGQMLRTTNGADRVLNYPDCLLVREFRRKHPVMQGLGRIATNRPSGIVLDRVTRQEWVSLARFPNTTLGSSGRPAIFDLLIASKNDDVGRILMCSDPSIFSNQMLVHDDNARLTLQAMNWLSTTQDGRKRSQLMFLIDESIESPDDPRGVDVELPTPTKEQVWNALKNLPPEKLLQVGNDLAAVVEDENIANEFLGMLMERVSKKHVARGLILLLTFFLAGVLFYRYMGSETTLQEATGTDVQEIGVKKRGWFRRSKKAAADRHMVARELVGRFYSKASAGKHNHYVGFPKHLEFVNCENEKVLRSGMNQTAKYLKWKSRRWWKQDRLLGLREQINYWELLLENGQLVCKSDEALPIPETLHRET